MKARNVVRLISALIALLGVSACATVSPEPIVQIGGIVAEYERVGRTQLQEATNAEEAVRIYENVLQAEAAFPTSFTEAQKRLQNSLRALEDRKTDAVVPDDAMLGLPRVYAQRLVTVTEAHQGLARIHMAKGQRVEAERHLLDAIELMKTRAHSAVFLSKSLIESYELMGQLQSKQGHVGKALVAKLNADLLKEYLASEEGRQARNVEYELLSGIGAWEQLVSVQSYVGGVNKSREHAAGATQMAVLGGITAANAALQSSMASAALAKSGGIVTPQVQMAQMNAKTAQLQAQMFTALMAQRTGTTKSFDGSSVSSLLPSLPQQLVDQRMGLDTPALVKGFAAQAVQVGGPIYEADAEQVRRSVDALASYQQTGKGDAMRAVGQFVDAFGNFVRRVQDIQGMQSSIRAGTSGHMAEHPPINPEKGQKERAVETASHEPKERPLSAKEAITAGGNVRPNSGHSIEGKDGASMLLIPSGSFWMGITDEEKARFEQACLAKFHHPGDKSNCVKWLPPQVPHHQVTLDAFYLDAYEVTNQLFEKFVKETRHMTPWNRPEEYQQENAMNNWAVQPVDGASWEDANAYCRWAGKRLPTEAEWEYAARAETNTRYWWGDSEPIPRRVANAHFSDPDDSSTVYKLWGVKWAIISPAPVGSYEPNLWGLYDMIGNVFEWVADWYEEAYYKASPDRNPTGPPSGQKKVLRGGSLESNISSNERSLSTFRISLKPSSRDFNINIPHIVKSDYLGFRCAQSVAR